MNPANIGESSCFFLIVAFSVSSLPSFLHRPFGCFAHVGSDVLHLDLLIRTFPGFAAVDVSLNPTTTIIRLQCHQPGATTINSRQRHFWRTCLRHPRVPESASGVLRPPIIITVLSSPPSFYSHRLATHLEKKATTQLHLLTNGHFPDTRKPHPSQLILNMSTRQSVQEPVPVLLPPTHNMQQATATLPR